MEDVKHWIFSPCWSYSSPDGKRECFYSPYQVLLQKDQFESDMSRIQQTDILYPLIVIESEYDTFGTILDGNHRFIKMCMLNKKNVSYQFITRSELDSLMISM